MSITPDSLTGNPSWDVVVWVFYVLRLTILATQEIVCVPQMIMDAQYFRQKKKAPNARWYTLFGLCCFPLFRFSYIIFILVDHRYDYGHYGVLVCSLGSTFFQFFIYIFVICFWMMLLYTYFISEKIRLENAKRCWRFSWGLIAFAAAFHISYLIMSPFVKFKILDVYYTAAFVFMMLLGGLLILINGPILMSRLKKHQSEVQGAQNGGDKIEVMIKKIKYLSYVVALSVVVIVIRNLVLYIKPVPDDSNIKHVSSFLIFLAETLTEGAVMLAIADRPLNYFRFKSIISSRKFGDVSFQPSQISGNSSKGMQTALDLGDFDDSSNNSGSASPQPNSVSMDTFSVEVKDESTGSGVIIEHELEQ
ncbi:hypothetical protein SAMD00019534_023970 [Acytostelium subglobosum LB1]|uniref:hypothetical protein n=1 Tax=Acytostelium subglobosum LB1 TaxID=1410327 RepID=UPI0006448C23|nr:hypothetical protein SAMD00019534_023970 [Acytostelium subglobosum LB1]GAM19222.1 hypothetical protein SAMD00019534_023970 [Acytostelium subglobosum LB1]|eukprot:XP_012757149.1 hypothetical protein SAMD00019534_023970 [Acytostelium subglobosum LB1]